MRVVEDYDVDRRQVQAWRHAQPSRTNHPNTFPGGYSARENYFKTQAVWRLVALSEREGVSVELLAFPSHDFISITGRGVPGGRLERDRI